MDQRVGLRYALSGLDAAECASYVNHHLALAGRVDTLFSDDAVALIHHASRGLPRAVNNLACRPWSPPSPPARAIVDESAAKMAVVEVTGE